MDHLRAGNFPIMSRRAQRGMTFRTYSLLLTPYSLLLTPHSLLPTHPQPHALENPASPASHLNRITAQASGSWLT